MTDDDRPAFAKLLALLSATYNEPVTEDRAEAGRARRAAAATARGDTAEAHP